MVIFSVFLAATIFALVGPWLGEELATTVVELGMNSGQGATLSDCLAGVLLFVLITPFVVVLELSPEPQFLVFALNGACWACACWGAWMACKAIRRRWLHRGR
jgi:hypothetical protein